MKPYFEVRTFCSLPCGAIHKWTCDHGIKHLAVKMERCVRSVMYVDTLTGGHRFQVQAVPFSTEREMVETEVVWK